MNGVPSCASDWLLKTVLRGEWEFDGYVTSDCDADSDVFYSHHYTPTTSDAVRVILAAGTDVDCGGFMTANAAQAIKDGNITEADIDVVLKRLFRVRLRLGHFDPPGVLQTLGNDQVCNPYTDEVARDGVRQSTVLVKNTAGLLPLNAASFSKVVAIGPNIDLDNTVGYYGSTPCPYYANWVPLTAIQQHVASATGVKGVPSVGSGDMSGIPAAAAAAAGADLIVLQIGSNLDLEAEGHDRLVIDFSPAQQALIANVTAAAPAATPIVAMVFSGGAMDISILLNNPRIGAVLICGQPSVQVVGAGDVLFGKTLDGRAVAPAARMSQMTYPADIVNQVSMFDFGMRPGPSAWPPGTNPGRTYRFFTGTPVLPFGFGLSYTTWQYTPIPGPVPPAATAAARMSFAAIDAAAKAHAARDVVGSIPKSLQAVAADFYVNVTNTGTVDSDDVVLGFLVPPGAGVGGVALQELFGFERVFVPAGQTVTVYLGAQGFRFCQTNKDGVRVAWPGEYTVRIGVKETAELGMGFAEFKMTMA